MNKQRIRLTEAAKILDVNPWTLRRKAYAGKIPCIISDTGRRYLPVYWVDEQSGKAPKNTDIRCAIYSRESSSENKSALYSQTEGLKQYAKAKGYKVVKIVEEFGSGVNDKRKKLIGLLKQKDFDVLLVEHKDRLSRFGVNYFIHLCPFKIEIINEAEDKETDLMEDLVAILTSFSARLYGQRRGRKKTLAAIEALKTK